MHHPIKRHQPWILALGIILAGFAWWVVRPSIDTQPQALPLAKGMQSADAESEHLELQSDGPALLGRERIDAPNTLGDDNMSCKLALLNRLDGSPLGLDRIAVHGPSGSHWHATPEGLQVSPGTWNLEPLDPGLSLSRSLVEARAFHEELILVSELLPLEVVVRSNTGAPVPGAHIRWHTANGEGAVTTGRGGTATLIAPLRTTVRFHSTHEGLQSRDTQYFFLSEGDEHLITLGPSDANDSPYTIEVVDASTGLPIAGASVETSPPTERVLTDSEGQAILSKRILINSSLFVHAPKYMARKTAVYDEALEFDRLRIPLAPARNLSVSCTSGRGGKDLTLIAIAQSSPALLPTGSEATQETPLVREFHPSSGTTIVLDEFDPQATRLLLCDEYGWSDEWGPDHLAPGAQPMITLETTLKDTLLIRTEAASQPPRNYTAAAELDIDERDIWIKVASSQESVRIPFPNLSRKIEIEGVGLAPLELGAYAVFAPGALNGADPTRSGVLHIELLSTRDVEVHVVDESGQPAFGYEVTYRDREPIARALAEHPELFGSQPTDHEAWLQRPTGPRQTARGLSFTNAQGTVILRDAPAWNTEIRVKPSEQVYPNSASLFYGFWPTELRAEADGPITLVVESRNLCDLRVLDASTGLPVLSFTVIGHRGQRLQPASGEDGRFVALLLPNEEVQVTADGFVNTEFQAPDSIEGTSARIDILLERAQTQKILFTGLDLNGAYLEYRVVQEADDPSTTPNRGRVELLEVDGGFAPKWNLPSRGMLYLDKVALQGEEFTARPSLLNLALVGSEAPTIVEVKGPK